MKALIPSLKILLMRFCEGFGTNFGKKLEEKYGISTTEV